MTNYFYLSYIGL